jgi:hypothetical protein
MSTEQKKKPGAGKIILIVIGVIFALGILASLTSNKKGSTSSNETSTASAATASSPSSSQVAIGQTLKTEYFDVTVNKAFVTRKIKDPSGVGMHAEADPGTKFLVINVTYKNTDTESRMVLDGSVFVDHSGKELNFDHSETLMIEGYRLFPDQLNPLLSKTTNLVYKIPEEATGAAFYNPGRSDNSDRITLGDIANL